VQVFANCLTVQKAGTVNKKGEIVDRQPVTIHTKIKSSGYSRAAPRYHCNVTLSSSYSPGRDDK